MSHLHEVENPIINSPYKEPKQFKNIVKIYTNNLKTIWRHLIKSPLKLKTQKMLLFFI